MRNFGEHGLSGLMAASALVLAFACAGCASSTGNSIVANAEGEGVSSMANSVDVNEGAASNASDGANSNANANVTAAPIVDGDAEDAQGVLPNGWYQASLSASSGASSLSITSVTLDGDTWTLVGSMTRADDEDALVSSRQQVGPNTWVLKVADGTVFEGGGGDAGNQTMDRATFENVMASLNGLGLVMHVEDGTVTYARLAS